MNPPPEFPIRILFDDGECLVVESPEELMAAVETIDSTDPAARLWIRDGRDRTVRLRMRNGWVEVFEAAPG
jgi:hypothetical protein